MKARGVDGNPARGAAKQERDRVEDKFNGSSHDKVSQETRYLGRLFLAEGIIVPG
jgi:hypothetical protein